MMTFQLKISTLKATSSDYLANPQPHSHPRRPRGFAAASTTNSGEKGKKEREKEKERTKLRERHLHAITSRMLPRLRQYRNFPLPAHADMNDVLTALVREASWTVDADGTTYHSIIYHDSLSFAANTGAPEKLELQNHRTEEGIRSTLVHIPLRSIQEKDEADSRNHKAVVAPFNVTGEERIAWFQENLNYFKILKSNNLTRQFHARVLGFFGRECEVQFFMTWISPASLFGGRELLSVESIFKNHPKACLIILSRTLDSRHGYRILKPLLDRGFKVQTMAPDLSFLLKSTPAEAWFKELRKGRKDPGEIPLSQNLSNLIRLAVLYKYGGVYIDTDFIVLKPLTGLRNSIGAQSMNLGKHWTRLNNAVLIFDMRHPLLHRFINEFALTFDGNKWGHNGPYLVSRVIQRLGKRHDFNVTILPPVAFYPVDWNKISGLFTKPKTQSESRWVEAKLLQLSEKTYGIHLWNKHTSRLTIEEGSVIGRLVSDYCVICNHKYRFR